MQVGNEVKREQIKQEKDLTQTNDENVLELGCMII